MKQGTMNILFFILKTKLLKNGEAPILMRITILTGITKRPEYSEAFCQNNGIPPKDAARERTGLPKN